MPSAAKKTAAGEIPAEFAHIASAFAPVKGATQGKMMSCFGLRIHNKIFTMFPRGKFVAKLPKARVDELVASGKGKRFEPSPGHPRTSATPKAAHPKCSRSKALTASITGNRTV